MKESSREPYCPRGKHKSSRSKKSRDSKSHAKGKPTKKQPPKSSPVLGEKRDKEKKDVELSQGSSKILQTDFEEQKTSDLPMQSNSLTEFLDNKEELIDQLFKTVHGAELQQIVPRTLKNCSTEDLKKMCLEQIRDMPNNLIRHVLSGGSADSYVEKNTVERTQETKKVVDPKKPNGDKNIGGKRKIRDEPSKSSGRETPSKKFATEESEKKSFAAPSPALSETISSDALELYPGTKEVEILGPEETQSVSNVELKPALLPEMSSDLELLELEMRARAIRSLLLAKGKSPSASSEDEDLEEEDKKHHFQ